MDVFEQYRVVRDDRDAVEGESPRSGRQGQEAVRDLVDGEHFRRSLDARPRPRDLADHAGETAEAGPQYGVLAGGEQFARGDPAVDELESSDGQDGDQDQRADDRGLRA